MPAWIIGILVALAILGLAVKPLRKATATVLLLLLAEVIVVMIWPRSLVWLAEVALRLRGVGNLF
jgi:hypothetical protein